MNKRRTREQIEKVKYVEGKTPNQTDYIRAIIENQIIFCSGPSGSGKSYIAAGMAANALHRNEVAQIVITRPIVCAGKDIGALPGELGEKIDPYLIPMREHLKFFLGRAYYGAYANDFKILFEPLELMRGRTFDNSFMILDEAQNCTFDQIKMFITRMGANSKVLINGDIKQTDILHKSGLQECINKLGDRIRGVQMCKLDYGDIQRNSILGAVLSILENE